MWDRNYLKMVRDLRTEFPKMKIKYKNETWHQKGLGYLMYPFNKNYLKTITTTMFGNIYFPSRKFVNDSRMRATRILTHEREHLRQGKKDKLFGVKYLFPQIFGIFAVLAFVNLWFLLFLLLFLPWPAPWRAKYEYDGYLVNMYFAYCYQPSTIDKYIVDMAKNKFGGKTYYFMIWNKDKYVKKFRESLEKREDDERFLDTKELYE